MEANYIIVGVAIAAAAWFVAYLFRQNQKDRKDYEEYLNRSKPKDETDVEDGL